MGVDELLERVRGDESCHPPLNGAASAKPPAFRSTK
jgi:hypothetical protein